MEQSPKIDGDLTEWANIPAYPVLYPIRFDPSQKHKICRLPVNMSGTKTVFLWRLRQEMMSFISRLQVI